MSALEQLVANMSVAQLAELAGMDVDSMVALVLGKAKKGGAAASTAQAAPARRGRRRAASSESAAQAAAPAQSSSSGKKSRNTRTREGREALDQAILSFLKEQPEPVRALDIRSGVGGTAAQIRTRLNSLIEEGKVTYTGRASGTRYKAK